MTERDVYALRAEALATLAEAMREVLGEKRGAPPSRRSQSR